MTTLHAELDGHIPTPAELNDLLPQLMGGYGHFTAAQVRDTRIQGLDLHLSRLDAASRELFGTPLDGDRIRTLIRQALTRSGHRDASLRVYGYGWQGTLSTVVTVRPPATPPEHPVSLRPVPYVRPFPQVKHLGGFAQTHYTLLAEQEGYDSALLTGPDGTISEGAVTNIGFWDGTSVVWPNAPALQGTVQSLLERHLPDPGGLPSARRHLTLDGLGPYRAAFVTNSQGIAAVHRIGDTDFPVDEDLMKTLGAVYAAAPWDEV
ncbi:aminotransferase class IV [Streptomyces sp. NBC_00237]|uniref:aminotransferase class IV n=1 Tax=Streptomyces sp. NBC_00237 TaxID=2975687 RepID=UPI00225C2681|nr:aminotransferase class IV [Streptomyces sp. NBC_00237]MCX5201350.1 aminotransferase class IV [Streptomyces sp. NBC_00237]